MPKLPEKSPFLFSPCDEMKKSSYFLDRPNTKIKKGIALEVAEHRQAIYCPYTVVEGLPADRG